jgi:hypothetical protein
MIKHTVAYKFNHQLRIIKTTHFIKTEKEQKLT